MEKLNAIVLKAGFIKAYQNLESNKELVNKLNVFPVPDGDTGTNMSLTMKSVEKKLLQANDDMKSVAKALGSGSLMGARGNSGVILSQLCRGVTNVLENCNEVGIEELAQACISAKETAYKAVLKPTEGTILTVSRMMAEFASENKDKYTDLIKFLTDIVKAGNEALNKTPELLPVLKQAGVVDAGGKGLMVLMEGFLASVSGKEVQVTHTYVPDSNIEFEDFEDLHDFEKPEDIKYGYCTEFFINHDGSQNYEEWREFISQYGDSIVCVGDDEMIKTHIHTEHPGQLLEFARERGYLTGIKIENMRVQFTERTEAKKQRQAEKLAEKKDYGFVAISAGEGFDNIFKDLGVDNIISGGQTMNPSTEDIVEACENINANTIFVFPNNKNIILAAKQAVEVVEDKKLIVVETKSIPQAFSALLNFDESASPEENLENMSLALEDVKTLELTYAVRATTVGDLSIEENDIIGINQKDIVTKGKDVNETMIDLIKKSIDDESGLVTIYYGKEQSEEEANKLLEALENEGLDLEFDLVYGGQPLYYYIASVE